MINLQSTLDGQTAADAATQPARVTVEPAAAPLLSSLLAFCLLITHSTCDQLVSAGATFMQKLYRCYVRHHIGGIAKNESKLMEVLKQRCDWRLADRTGSTLLHTLADLDTYHWTESRVNYHRYRSRGASLATAHGSAGVRAHLGRWPCLMLTPLLF